MSRNYLQSHAFQQQVEADAERDDRLAAIRAARQQHAPMTITGANTMNLTETSTDRTTDPPPPSTTTRFCKDCKHVVAPHGMRYARCALSSNAAGRQREYLVSGELPKPELGFCTAFRMFDDSHDCGPSGRLFEPREST